MATGSPAALRRALPGVGVAVLVAALVRLVYAPWYGNYDVRYALLWARDLLHGHNPDYEAAFAPTPHPLSIAWSSLGLPFGDSAGSVMVILSLVGLGALVWILFRLGREDKPRLGLTSLAGPELVYGLFVGMDLNGELIAGKEKFHEQRETGAVSRTFAQ